MSSSPCGCASSMADSLGRSLFSLLRVSSLIEVLDNIGQRFRRYVKDNIAAIEIPLRAGCIIAKDTPD